MTDWLPWAAVMMAGIFTTIELALRALQEAKGAAPDLRKARIAFIATIVASLLVYGMYLVFEESWLWYT
jgi:hypothetical protein